MAREDATSLTSSTELQDLSFHPASVRPAKITIIHPQLRDLVLPLEQGRVLYPRGTTVEEQKWEHNDEAESLETIGTRRQDPGVTRTFAQLTFTPNCLTASGGILACGGQHGELFLTDIPQAGPSMKRLNTKYISSPPPVKPFALAATLPTRSINNSLIILPGYPGGWKQAQEERKVGYVGARRRRATADLETGEATEIHTKDEEDMDLDDVDQEVQSPPFATFPNTVPFPSNVRRSSHSASSRPRPPSATAPSSSGTLPSSVPRQIIRPIRPSGSNVSIISEPGHPPIQLVSSLSETDIRLPIREVRREPSAPLPGVDPPKPKVPKRLVDEPRILISNNDQTVKMFSLRPGRPADPNAPQSTYERTFWESRYSVPSASPPAAASRAATVVQRQRDLQDAREQRLLERMGLGHGRSHDTQPPLGSRFGWDSIRLSDGNAAADLEEIRRRDELFNRELERTDQELDNLRRQREDFERLTGIRVGTNRAALRPNVTGPRTEDLGQLSPGPITAACPPQPTVTIDQREQRKLAKVGGARFKYAINHSSMSPDLRSMICVGDSTDVYLFEVSDGGKSFKLTGIYTGSNDAGFSTAWSKDGRKFAVASQDGQVTVWDHRSSKPLAIFHTSSSTSSVLRSFAPTFSSDSSSSHLRRLTNILESYGSDLPEWSGIRDSSPRFVEPSTARTYGSREAARVVKFSPEGSSRDLMVFSEESSSIHIVDVRDFHTHVILPVPHYTSNPLEPLPHRQARSEVDNAYSGLAGIAFDPTGDWLYSGTERTVVEWDMRRTGGGRGTWAMA